MASCSHQIPRRIATCGCNERQRQSNSHRLRHRHTNDREIHTPDAALPVTPATETHHQRLTIHLLSSGVSRDGCDDGNEVRVEALLNRTLKVNCHPVNSRLLSRHTVNNYLCHVYPL